MSVSRCTGFAARWVLGLAIAGASLFGQQQPPLLPDCLIQIPSDAAPGTSAAFDNRGLNCVDWIVVYNSTGFSAISEQLESSTDNAGAPTGFVAFAGTVLTGSNPSSILNESQITFTGYYPWLRLNFVSKTGTGSISITAYGYRKNQSGVTGGGGGGGGCSTPCVVIGPDSPGAVSSQNPVQVAGNDGTDVRAIKTDTSGRTQVVGAAATGSAPVGAPVPQGSLDHSGNVIIPNFCNAASPISLTSVTGENQIIALSGSTVIRICNIAVGMTAAVTVSIDVGTGSNCGTSTTTVWGPYPGNTTGFAQDFAGVLVIPAGNAVCLNFGGTVTAGGGVSYVQY